MAVSNLIFSSTLPASPGERSRSPFLRMVGSLDAITVCSPSSSLKRPPAAIAWRRRCSRQTSLPSDRVSFSCRARTMGVFSSRLCPFRVISEWRRRLVIALVPKVILIELCLDLLRSAIRPVEDS